MSTGARAHPQPHLKLAPNAAVNRYRFFILSARQLGSYHREALPAAAGYVDPQLVPRNEITSSRDRVCSTADRGDPRHNSPGGRPARRRPGAVDQRRTPARVRPAHPRERRGPTHPRILRLPGRRTAPTSGIFALPAEFRPGYGTLCARSHFGINGGAHTVRDTHGERIRRAENIRRGCVNKCKPPEKHRFPKLHHRVPDTPHGGVTAPRSATFSQVGVAGSASGRRR